jgi:hypothetical protein
MIEKFNSVGGKSIRDFSPADLIPRASDAKCLFLRHEEGCRAGLDLAHQLLCL